MLFELTVLGRNGVAVVEDQDNGKFYIDGSGGVEHHSSSIALNAQSATRHTNRGSTAEVDITLPAAVEGETRELCNLTGFNLKAVAAGTDTIQRGQAYPTGAAHIQSSEANATLRLECFSTGVWHVMSAEGQWSMGS